MSNVLELNADSWKKEVSDYKYLVVVDFWHSHCPWCLKFDPVYAEVSEEYKDKVKFTKLNVLETDENRNIAIRYGVMATPTLIFFCEGRSIETATGFQPGERLKQIIEDVIGKHQDCMAKSTPIETD